MKYLDEEGNLRDTQDYHRREVNPKSKAFAKWLLFVFSVLIVSIILIKYIL